MTLEYLKFSVDKLQAFNDKIDANINTSYNLEEELGNTVIRYIGKSYKDHTEKVLDSLRNHPKDAIPIVLNRFKKRIEEVQASKIEAEKNIKPQYEKFYAKSLDYRSLRFKNSEKKNNNAKAFNKEISQRKKDKLITNNINILRGGVENFEFYITINLKFFKENIAKTLRQIDDHLKSNPLDATSNALNNTSENNKAERYFSGESLCANYENYIHYSDVLMKNITKVE